MTRTITNTIADAPIIPDKIPVLILGLFAKIVRMFKLGFFYYTKIKEKMKIIM